MQRVPLKFEIDRNFVVHKEKIYAFDIDKRMRFKMSANSAHICFVFSLWIIAVLLYPSSNILSTTRHSHLQISKETGVKTCLRRNITVSPLMA